MITSPFADPGYLRELVRYRENGTITNPHAKLRQRAGRKGYSLQEYLLRKLVEEASQPDLDEILERASQRSGGSLPLAKAAEAMRAERDAR